MKTCLIISGGEFAPLPDTLKYDFVIACDHGYDYALRLQITPDLIMGDFDSCNTDIGAVNGIPVETFPVAKDDTDTMLAIKKAISLGYNNIILACALGARFDHTMANIQSMAYAALHECECELYGNSEYFCTMVRGSKTFSAAENSSFSLFSLTDSCKGVSISGAEYDCENITLTNTFPLGVSNKWKADSITVSLTEGILLVVESLYR